MANVKSGEEFLNKIYKDLWKSSGVMNSNRKTLTNGPIEKLENYMKRLEVAHNSGKENISKILKEFYYKKYVIKEENVPQSYFELQQRVALEMGHGHLTIDDHLKREMIDNIKKDQKASLDCWLDYFESEDTKLYPMWFKYWTFQGMLKLGVYDKATQKFRKRTNQTVAPFIGINREVLAKTYDFINKMLKSEEISSDEALNKLIANGSFQKIYTYLIKEQYSKTKEFEKRNDGVWKKYNQGDDHMPLVKSLEGYGTGWCTAGEDTAKMQLSMGDFYAFYTNDGNGNYVVPRIAIRMEENEIAEVRGVADSQNIEGEMTEITDKKLDDFSDKEKYKKKVIDMRRLTEIYNKHKQNIDMTKSELKLLYEMDQKIERFGYGEDPRIKEILDKRNIKDDISYVINCNPNQISLTREEALNGNIKYHFGDILYKTTTVEGVELPDEIYGDLCLDGLTTAEGLKLPDSVGGDLILDGLTTAKGLKLPDNIGGKISLRQMITAEGLKLPHNINGDLLMDKLTTTKGLELPDSVGGNLILDGLKTVEGLVLPDNVEESLLLNDLKIAEGLKLPDNVGGFVELNGLMNAKGLTIPDSFEGGLYLKSLITAKGLNLPNNVKGGLFLPSLTTAEDLKLPNNIEGALLLNELIDAEGLELPTRIGGILDIRNLSNLEGLNLPDNIEIEGTIIWENNQMYELAEFKEIVKNANSNPNERKAM